MYTAVYAGIETSIAIWLCTWLQSLSLSKWSGIRLDRHIYFVNRKAVATLESSFSHGSWEDDEQVQNQIFCEQRTKIKQSQNIYIV